MGNRVIVLGAGASRGVNYASEMDQPSPLDSDFFDLLQRNDAKLTEKGRVFERLNTLPYQTRRSMERAFYSLHLRAYLAEKFQDEKYHDSAAEIVSDFACTIQSLLRRAHGEKTCTYHANLFKDLEDDDAIISFNYDLVAERALRKVVAPRQVLFHKGLYGFGSHQIDRCPILLKLHGSSNWLLNANTFSVRTKKWTDFDRAPGYMGHKGKGTVFPIFLPFWDKRIEKEPWLALWTRAFQTLRRSQEVLVWGYSLPPTDVKAQQLFTLSLSETSSLRLCVVDPSRATRSRWRELFPNARYWEYRNASDFLKHPPSWWKLA
jgi:hypothetical protein